jgi:hypothetical protein
MRGIRTLEEHTKDWLLWRYWVGGEDFERAHLQEQLLEHLADYADGGSCESLRGLEQEVDWNTERVCSRCCGCECNCPDSITFSDEAELS